MGQDLNANPVLPFTYALLAVSALHVRLVDGRLSTWSGRVGLVGWIVGLLVGLLVGGWNSNMIHESGSKFRAEHIQRYGLVGSVGRCLARDHNISSVCTCNIFTCELWNQKKS